jgi:hypothetical protein
MLFSLKLTLNDNAFNLKFNVTKYLLKILKIQKILNLLDFTYFAILFNYSFNTWQN